MKLSGSLVEVTSNGNSIVAVKLAGDHLDITSKLNDKERKIVERGIRRRSK